MKCSQSTSTCNTMCNFKVYMKNENNNIGHMDNYAQKFSYPMAGDELDTVIKIEQQKIDQDKNKRFCKKYRKCYS